MKILGTIGATLAIVAVMVMVISAAGTSTNPKGELAGGMAGHAGATQSFNTPCDPCGSDGGTGTELLMAWVDDWFDDYGDGDGLDEDVGHLTTAEPDGGSPAPTSNPVLSASMT